MTEKEQQIKEIYDIIIKPYKRARTAWENFINKEQAEALYNAGYRKKDSERDSELLNDVIDVVFHGAVLRFAEKLKGRIREVVFILDDEIANWDILIDETAKKFLESET